MTTKTENPPLLNSPSPQSNDPGVLSRARGCLLGQIAGDSLGSLVEFQRGVVIQRRHPEGLRELVNGGHWKTLAGQPTDDSEMALMLARALVEKSAFDEEAIAAAYAHWYRIDPFDMGATTARALGPAASAARGFAAPAARAAASHESQANGALMRVSPLGIFGFAMPANVLADLARTDARLTHPHPACCDASAVFVVTIAHCIAMQTSGKEAYSFACEWAKANAVHGDIQQLLADAGKEPPAEFSKNMGWIRIAFQNAFYRLKHADTLEAGVVETVMQGGDTDTNAAIAGALLGALHGENAVPAQWRQSILNCRPQPGSPGVHRPRPPEFWPVDVLQLAEKLLKAGQHE